VTATVAPLLTGKQQQVLTEIRAYATEHGYAPSLRDLAGRTGLPVTTVSDNVRRLADVGWISRHPHRPRALVVLNPADGSDT